MAHKHNWNWSEFNEFFEEMDIKDLDNVSGGVVVDVKMPIAGKALLEKHIAEAKEIGMDLERVKDELASQLSADRTKVLVDELEKMW